MGSMFQSQTSTIYLGLAIVLALSRRDVDTLCSILMNVKDFILTLILLRKYQYEIDKESRKDILETHLANVKMFET